MTIVDEMTDWLVEHAVDAITPELSAKLDALYAAEPDDDRFEAGRRAALQIERRVQARRAGAEDESET